MAQASYGIAMLVTIIKLETAHVVGCADFPIKQKNTDIFTGTELYQLKRSWSGDNDY